uniref:Uncharacterized protein n=1 Tax=Setaria italica TaxID=4555 RepID=K3Z1Z1_SETIT
MISENLCKHTTKWSTRIFLRCSPLHADSVATQWCATLISPTAPLDN